MPSRLPPISAINKRLDESLDAFANPRPLCMSAFYLILDARYEKNAMAAWSPMSQGRADRY